MDSAIGPAADASETPYLISVVYAGDQYVATGNYVGINPSTGFLITSPDGETWTVQPAGPTSMVSRMVWWRESERMSQWVGSEGQTPRRDPAWPLQARRMVDGLETITRFRGLCRAQHNLRLSMIASDLKQRCPTAVGHGR